MCFCYYCNDAGACEKDGKATLDDCNNNNDDKLRRPDEIADNEIVEAIDMYEHKGNIYSREELLDKNPGKKWEEITGTEIYRVIGERKNPNPTTPLIISPQPNPQVTLPDRETKNTQRDEQPNTRGTVPSNPIVEDTIDTPTQDKSVDSPPSTTKKKSQVKEKAQAVEDTIILPDVDIVNVEFKENPKRLIVTLKNNMEEAFVMCEGLGKFELRRSNNRVLTSSNFRLVNLTFKKTTIPVLLPGETAKVYLSDFSDYNALIPLYHEEGVRHYIHLNIDRYNSNQSLILYYSMDGKLKEMDRWPDPVPGAPSLQRPKNIGKWAELKLRK